MKIEVELSGPAGSGKTLFAAKLYSAIRHCIQVECWDLPAQQFDLIIATDEEEAHYKPIRNRK